MSYAIIITTYLVVLKEKCSAAIMKSHRKFTIIKRIASAIGKCVKCEVSASGTFKFESACEYMPSPWHLHDRVFDQ